MEIHFVKYSGNTRRGGQLREIIKGNKVEINFAALREICRNTN